MSRSPAHPGARPLLVSAPALVLGLALAAMPAAAAAEAAEEPAEPEGPELGWKREAEVHLVSTAGNSESHTLGFRATLVRTMPRSRLSLATSALRVESTLTERTAVGPSSDDFTIESISRTALTAEHFSLGGRYEHTLSNRVFWHLGTTWERNEFAGYSDRLTCILGAGHHWWDRESGSFATDYAVTYTDQNDLVPNPEIDDTFAGLRLSYDYTRRRREAVELHSSLVVHHNLEETEDLRLELANSVAVTMTRRLALKVGLEVLWDDLPALGLLPLQLPDGTPTDVTVPFELEELDTVFTTALVVHF